MGLGTLLKGVIWPLASLLAVNSVPTAMAGELDGDFRIWNEYKLTEYSRDRWTTFTWAEARFVDDASQVGLWLLQQKAYRTLSERLILGIGASVLDAKQSSGGWNSQSRLELELNPR